MCLQIPEETQPGAHGGPTWEHSHGPGEATNGGGGGGAGGRAGQGQLGVPADSAGTCGAIPPQSPDPPSVLAQERRC